MIGTLALLVHAGCMLTDAGALTPASFAGRMVRRRPSQRRRPAKKTKLAAEGRSIA